MINMLEHAHTNLEVKEINTEGKIIGYASIYGNVDAGGDIMMPGAFSGSLEKMRVKGYKPKMLWQHDPAQPIGVWEAMREDEKGLLIQGRILGNIRTGAEAIELLKAGAIDGLSVGYRALEDEFISNEKGMIRQIKSAELWETSLVTFPMNEEARVTDVKQLQSPRDVERILREAGVPSGFAKLVALHGFGGATKALKDDQRDADGDDGTSEQFAALMETLGELKGLIHAQG